MDQDAYKMFYIAIFVWFAVGFTFVFVSMIYGKITDGKRIDHHDS